MLVAMSLSWCRLGRFSNSSPGKVPARRRMRCVGSLRWLVSRASEGQWLKLVMILCTCAWAVKPLFELFFMVCVKCSIPICVALSLVEGEPQPSFLECALYTLRGEGWEKCYGLSHRLVEDAVYVRELAVIKDSEVSCMVFGFK